MIGKIFKFVDTSWNVERTIATFRYRIETSEQSFDLAETLELPFPAPDNSVVSNVIRSLHLALGISYYKSFVPPEFVHPYAMDENEAAFWNTVYINGLGEFLYNNKLDAGQLASFTEQKGLERSPQQPALDWTSEALLGIGGGKDSIVAGELLRKIGVEPTGFVLATGEILGQTRAVTDVMKASLIPIKRQLDLQILEINKLEGAYNGHIPISLIFALCGCLLAASRGSKYVVVANEASASIPQVKWQGNTVNHQWSKSLEFERLFQEYVHAYISEELSYFSAIRPLTSLGVARLFSEYKDYFPVFTSDNSVFRIKQGERDHPRWSGDSPKSLSSFILLAPWMDDDELMRTFGRNFLDKPELEELFVSLLGRSNTPILDCVGTPDELLYSLQKLHTQKRFIDSALMQKAVNEGLVANGKSTVDAELITDEQAFPEELADKLSSVTSKELLK
jgi:hypothetical protein